MSTPWIDIVAELRWRWSAAGPLHARMIDVRDRYNGGAVDYVVPFDRQTMAENLDSLAPPIIAEAIDNLATRANEIVPTILVPQLQAGKETGIRSREYANLRRAFLGEFWEFSRFQLLMGRAFRQLGAYATFALAVVPDLEGKNMPRMRGFDPLSCFPDPLANEDVSDPKNVGFITGMSSDQIVAKFGDGPKGTEVKRLIAMSGNNSNMAHNDMWDVALWCDEHEWVMGIMGPRLDEHGRSINNGGTGWHTSCMELWRESHRLSKVPFVVPRRVTLDAMVSSLANLTDQADVMAKMMRLQIAAAEKAIFPDRYVIGSDTVPMVLNDGENRWKDGRDGEINKLMNVEQVGNLPGTPDPVGERAMDRLERNIRVGTGLTPSATGDSTNGLRTGRAIDRLNDSATDPRIREMHNLAMTYLPQLNEIALEMAESHPKMRGQTYYLFSGAPGDFVRKEFKPSEHVEGVFDNKVNYSIPGAGVTEAGVALTGLVGAKIISRATSREMHPLVKDAELERARIAEEDLEEAMMQGLLQQLVAGNMPPMMAALIEKHQSSEPDIDIFEAVRRADNELREMQAAEAEATEPAAQPGLAPGAPVAAQPPAPQEMQPTIGPPGQLGQVRELTNALRVANRGPM